jgi:hypothetical protein
MALTRRKFLEDIAILGMSVKIPPGLVISDRWNFLKDTEKLPMQDPDDIRESYAQIGPVDDLDELDCGNVKQKIMPTIIKEARKEGLAACRVISEQSTYGVSASAGTVKEVMEYAVQAYTFMKSSIKGIVPFTLEWVLFKDTDNYSQVPHNKAFIGKGFYTLYYHEVRTLQGAHCFELQTINPQRGGFFRFDSKNQNIKPHAFISTGRSALRTPFSELLPLTTYSNIRKYDSLVGLCEAAKADETFVEAASQVLAEKLVQELHVPSGLSLVQKEFSDGIKVNPLYNQVAQSQQWIKVHGLQNAFDLYMDSPAKYLAAIKKV